METTTDSIDGFFFLKRPVGVVFPWGLEFREFRITILPHSPFPPVLHFQITFLFHFNLGLEEEEGGEATKKSQCALAL